jgi:hypothetical protein
VPQKINRLGHGACVGAGVRVKRRGKSSPAGRVTGLARQTPSGARPNRGAVQAGRRGKAGHRGALFDRLHTDRPDPLRLPGRSLEAQGNRRPRKMIIRAPRRTRKRPARYSTESGLRARHDLFFSFRTDQNALPATMRTLAYGLNSAERMIPFTSSACSLNSRNGTSSTSISPTILRISW